MTKVTKYHKNNSSYNLAIKLLEKLTLSDNITALNRETFFIEDICKRVQKSKTVLYILENDKDIIGLVSLSATSISEQPSLQIDYILINKPYQGKILEYINNSKPFRYLIKLAISVAENIIKDVGLRYIVLSPDTDDLEIKYKQVGFEILHDDWMYLKV